MGGKPRQPAGGVPRFEAPETVYVLKQVSAQMRAHGGGLRLGDGGVRRHGDNGKLVRKDGGE